MCKGDIIECRDKEDAISKMHSLEMAGITTDFLCEKDGQSGLWLEVVSVLGKALYEDNKGKENASV